MEVICHTPSRLTVTHREPTARIVAVLTCLAFIVSGGIVASIKEPPAPELSGFVTGLLVVILSVLIAGAFYAARCSETYTFDKEKQSFSLAHASPLGRRRRSGHLQQIREVYQESYDDNDSIKEYLILVVAPRGDRVRLPLRLYTFSVEERERFGELLCSFLEMPIRVERK